MIEDGRRVSIEYTLKLASGGVADTNVGEDPLVYEHGSGELLPGFERALAGMDVAETRAFVLPPEEGYGTVDPELHQEVQAHLVPEEARRAGAQLASEDASGQRRIVRVHEVREDTIVIDLNHPLAGETLHFEVKVLAIE